MVARLKGCNRSCRLPFGALRPQLASGLTQQLLGAGPAQAAVGNRNAVLQSATQRLATFEQMAFDHHADQRAITFQALLKHVIEHGWLAQRVFATVGVAAIDHDPRWNRELVQIPIDPGDAVAIVVRAAMAAAQYQMGVRVAWGLDDCRMAL